MVICKFPFICFAHKSSRRSLYLDLSSLFLRKYWPPTQNTPTAREKKHFIPNWPLNYYENKYLTYYSQIEMKNHIYKRTHTTDII